MQTDHTTHDPTPSKRCPKCGETKPATTEYFTRQKDRKDGLQRWCKNCMSEYQIEWRRANKERSREIYSVYRKANPERVKESQRNYREANRERRRGVSRAWREANPERVKEAVRIYREANKELVRQWKRAGNLRRRARKAKAEGTHTAADIRAQYKRQKGRCYYAACGYSKLGKKGWHVEHTVPLSRDGFNDPSNIVIACKSCNSSKGAKLPHEWAAGGRLL